MRRGWLVVLMVQAGCGPATAFDPDAGTCPDGGAADMDGGPPAPVDGGRDPDGGPPPVVDRAPCDTASCWLGAQGLGACRGSTVDEDFSTGLYSVHRYALTMGIGSSVDVSLQVTGGDWSPALIVHDATGVTLYDGERAAAAADVSIVPGLAGRSGSTASLGIAATADTTLYLFVTSWEAVDSLFEGSVPTTATYTLRTTGECPIGDAVCPVPPEAITRFASGFYTEPDDPYMRDGRTSHHGYDIDVPVSTEVLATQAGEIVDVVTTDGGGCGLDVNPCGLAINLGADSGVTFRYCHLSRVDVEVGTRVAVGQRIGLSGETGNACYPHLHFGYLDGEDVRGSGLGSVDYRSALVNEYVDRLCR